MSASPRVSQVMFVFSHAMAALNQSAKGMMALAG